MFALVCNVIDGFYDAVCSRPPNPSLTNQLPQPIPSPLRGPTGKSHSPTPTRDKDSGNQRSPRQPSNASNKESEVTEIIRI